MLNKMVEFGAVIQLHFYHEGQQVEGVLRKGDTWDVYTGPLMTGFEPNRKGLTHQEVQDLLEECARG